MGNLSVYKELISKKTNAGLIESLGTQISNLYCSNPQASELPLIVRKLVIIHAELAKRNIK